MCLLYVHCGSIDLAQSSKIIFPRTEDLYVHQCLPALVFTQRIHLPTQSHFYFNLQQKLMSDNPFVLNVLFNNLTIKEPGVLVV